MNKKTIKILSFVTIVLCIIMFCFNVFAEISFDSLDNNGNIDTSDLTSKAGTIAAIIRNVAVVLAVAILIVLGIKYMLGSVEEKSEYKKAMLPYVIGAGLLFGAGGIAQVVIIVAEQIK